MTCRNVRCEAPRQRVSCGGAGKGSLDPRISRRSEMDFNFPPEQEAIRSAITKVCAAFDLEYWLQKDRAGSFPHDFHAALARDGWLGIAMPVEYGGAGLGIVEAALMMQTITASGAGMSGASAVHMNIFSLNPVVVFGTDAQKQCWLPPLIAGRA